jgi:hypothetical protein
MSFGRNYVNWKRKKVMQKSVKQHAGSLLDQLKEFDRATSNAYYEMGQLLSNLDRDDMVQVLGYDSFSALIEEELSYTQTTAMRYRDTYRHFRRLKIKKVEAVGMIQKYGYTHIARVLPKMKQGPGYKRTMAKLVKEDRRTHLQVNFQVTPKEKKQLEDLLLAYGAENKGRYLFGASTALMAVVAEFDIKDIAA